MSARVSVIIPAFNDQSGVDRCLSAIAAQTYPLDAVEAIVVDNGSIPPLVLDRIYPVKVRLLRCETPGSYAARNAGARTASGEIFAFIDADCWPDDDWLASGVCSALASDGKAVIGGKVRIVAPKKSTAVALYQYVTGFGQKSNVREKGFAATANLFCTRPQFHAVGPFDERLLSGGDREWCWRATRCSIGIEYDAGAMVYTEPRTGLRGAIRQARRVIAGRRMLRELGLAHIGDAAVGKQRSGWQAIRWIVSNPRLDMRDRLRVLSAAAAIRGAEALENCRLALGGRAERR